MSARFGSAFVPNSVGSRYSFASPAATPSDRQTA
jgi:hypothetical protein